MKSESYLIDYTFVDIDNYNIYIIPVPKGKPRHIIHILIWLLSVYLVGYMMWKNQPTTIDHSSKDYSQVVDSNIVE